MELLLLLLDDSIDKQGFNMYSRMVRFEPFLPRIFQVHLINLTFSLQYFKLKSREQDTNADMNGLGRPTHRGY